MTFTRGKSIIKDNTTVKASRKSEVFKNFEYNVPSKTGKYVFGQNDDGIMQECKKWVRIETGRAGLIHKY